MGLNLPCTCECHHHCHTCGRKLVGPNDVHVNCGDTLSPPSTQGVYTAPNPNEPWPTEVVDPDDFTEFEREGYGDHGSPA
jgi:hypothetical protein